MFAMAATCLTNSIADNMAKLFDQIRNKPHDFPAEEWSAVSEDAKDLINQMLTKDPEQRISAADCLTGIDQLAVAP